MEQIVIDLLRSLGASVWIIGAIPVLGWLVKEPLSAVLKTREIRQKDRQTSIDLLKSDWISEPMRYFLSEELERSELRRYTGTDLGRSARELVMGFVRSHAPWITWTDVRNAQTHFRFQRDGSLQLEVTWLERLAYRAGVVWTISVAFVGFISFLLGIYVAAESGNPLNIPLGYAVLYLGVAVFTQIFWVNPYRSVQRLVPHFPLRPVAAAAAVVSPSRTEDSSSVEMRD